MTLVVADVVQHDDGSFVGRADFGGKALLPDVQISPSRLLALLAQRRWVRELPKHTLKHLQQPIAGAASRAELEAAGERGACGAGALRAVLPGGDASGDQSV